MDTNTLLMVLSAVVFVGGIGFVLTMPDNSQKAKKRAASLNGSGANAKSGSAATGDNQKDRRKHVTESLKKIEDKKKEAKSQKKVSLPQAIEQAGFNISVRDFYMVSGIVGLILLGVGIVTAQKPWVIGAMGIVGMFGLPRWFLTRARKKRQKKFVDEFSNAIDVIVRGVKSGLPVNECLKIIARDAASPVKEEFHLLVEGIRLGLSMEQSLDRMCQRMPVGEVKFFAIVLIIQKQTGGNLASALGNLAGVLRSRKSMLGKIAALSMEAKASAAILAAMPFFVSGLVYMSAPDYIAPLFETRTGNFMLIGAALWMLTGILVMKNMISIKV
ncbi:MAG: type II secretion system F family protein [Parvularcula sp.]